MFEGDFALLGVANVPIWFKVVVEGNGVVPGG